LLFLAVSFLNLEGKQKNVGSNFDDITFGHGERQVSLGGFSLIDKLIITERIVE
jgi:hypothetical protein